jgi:hypothetical protein
MPERDTSPARRRPARDPRRALARLVLRLEDRQAFVTLEDIVAGGRRSLAAVAPEEIAGLVEAAVIESLLLKDLRTFFDRNERSFDERWVYRLNPRHPIGRDLLESGE